MRRTLSRTLLLYALVMGHSFAASYNLPPQNKSLIGNLQYRYINPGDSLSKITQQYDIGLNSVKLANPQLQTGRLIAGSSLIIPTLHLLPNLPRKGIIINLPEMRIYYFPKNSNEVLTYPVGIGKVGNTIPITQTAIIRKTKNPRWVPPPSIRAFNLEQGIVLPKYMPPGPDNPLGPYAIYMRLPTFLIHSTIFPESVGTRASFGCIRMFENDIEEFFPTVSSGIPVAIVNKPTKIGWEDDELLLEVHPPLEEQNPYDTSLRGIVDMISNKYASNSILIDWQAVAYISEERDGIPHDIGIRVQ
jgi:L,D-transpeptidase ErfK/SrfK